MNRTPRKDTVQINFRLKPKEKERIDTMARKCGLSTTEYLRQRALGYEPTAAPPDAFFSFYRQLCDFTNALAGKVTSETEQRYLALADEIHSALLGSKKE